MADVAVTVQQITEVGLSPSFQGSLSASDRYQFPNDGRTILHVKKSGAGSCVATVVTPGTVGVGDLAIADRTVTIAASTGDVMIGPLPPSVYNDANGLCSVTFSEITGLTMAVLRL